MTKLARTGMWPGILLAAAILLVCLVLALALGPASLSVGRIWHLLFAGPVKGDLDNAIFWQIRMPRVLTAALVGAALAVAGVILQDLFLNPLTDPYVTGVSSGAALGATIGIVLHLSNLPWITVLAIVGGLGTLVIVWMAARRRGRIDIFVLLLAGVTISYLASALVTVLMIKANEDMTAIIYWLMGSFSGRGWPDVRVALVTIPFMVAPLFFTREMDILLQGEKRALELGVEVERTKRLLLVTAGVLTALAVSVSGIIAFVGLVVPHVVRLLIGPGHRGLLPVSLLAGASLMVLADLLSRTVISPNEIPVGVVTTFIGAPLFVYLLRRGRRGVTAAQPQTAAQPAAAPLVALKDVDFAYDERPVLRRISFSLEPGDFVGIVGPNGSGKSTLVDLIDGIHQPAAGEVLVNGVPTSKYRRKDMAREVALVPQHFDLDFDLAVREVVEMGSYCRGKDPAACDDPDLDAGASRGRRPREPPVLGALRRREAARRPRPGADAAGSAAAARRAGVRPGRLAPAAPLRPAQGAQCRRAHGALHPARPQPGAALLRQAARAQRRARSRRSGRPTRCCGPRSSRPCTACAPTCTGTPAVRTSRSRRGCAASAAAACIWSAAAAPAPA